MTHRDRWKRTMAFLPVDHVPDEEFGFWPQTLDRWYTEGLPRSVCFGGLWPTAGYWGEKSIYDYFGFAPRYAVPVRLGVWPEFEAKVLEEQEDYKVIQNEEGATCLVHKDGAPSMPHYLRYPIETREDWQKFLDDRLVADSPGRYPSNWDEMKKEWANRDYPLGIGIGSLFGWLRNWLGIEAIAIACCEDPDWVHEMMENLTELFLAGMKQAVTEVDLDFASFWEDMAYKSGPLISPNMFREFMVPRYQRVTSFLNEHGINVIDVDCDGNIHSLVEHWLDAGINCMTPLEIAAGTSPERLRDQFGQRLLMMGGVDKRVLNQGKEAVRKEVARVAKLAEQGGYIPHLDHLVPYNISFDEYRYYLDAKRDALGIPTPHCGLTGALSSGDGPRGKAVVG